MPHPAGRARPRARAHTRAAACLLLAAALMAGPPTCHPTVTFSKWRCEVPGTTVRTAIGQVAHRVLAAVLRQDADAWRRDAVPALTRQLAPEDLPGITKQHGLLGSPPLPAAPTEVFVVTIEGAARIVDGNCGTGDHAEDLRVRLRHRGAQSRVAFVRYVLPTPPLSYCFDLKLAADDDGRWKLQGLQFIPCRYRGESATHYERLAKHYQAEGKALAADLAYLVAAYLADPLPTLQRSVYGRVVEGRKKLLETAEYKAQTRSWPFGDRSRPVVRTKLRTTPDEVFPNLAYVTDGPLEEAPVEAEVEPAWAHLRSNHPELLDLFKHVGFEAFNEPPVEVRPYPLYRVLHPLAAPRQHPHPLAEPR